MATPDEISSYWFGPSPATTADELRQKMARWYQGGPAVGEEIRQRFAADVERALDGSLDDWAGAARTRLSLILLLDQFTRSVFADTPRAFAGDPAAQKLAREALDAGWDRELSLEERQFLLMPLLHSESTELLARCVTEMQRLNADAPEELRPVFAVGLAQAEKYLDVVSRFGRFPHRNRALGRTSTPEEEQFLQTFRQAPAPAK